jgi:hypothetical protein
MTKVQLISAHHGWHRPGGGKRWVCKGAWPVSPVLGPEVLETFMQAQTFLREHPSQPPLRCITITDEHKRSRVLLEQDHTQVNCDTNANALIEGLITHE